MHHSGAISASGGTLKIADSSVTDNSAALEASLPDSVEMAANGGGIHLAGDVSVATISNTAISRDAISMTNTVGDSEAFSGGVHVNLGTDFTMSNSVVADNKRQLRDAHRLDGRCRGRLRRRRGPREDREHARDREHRRRRRGKRERSGRRHLDAQVPDGPPGGPLTLSSTSVTGNALSGNAGITLRGGGLYLQGQSPTLTQSVIAGNTPDQCFGR